MKFCPVVPEICCGQDHGPRKERRKRKIITIIRNRAKTISLPNIVNRQLSAASERALASIVAST
jgi:hypothetical protein